MGVLRSNSITYKAANYGIKAITAAMLSIATAGFSADTLADGKLETPKDGATISGKALFPSWHCDASLVEMELPSGTINFDVKVTQAGDNITGWSMKADCLYPCTSGDRQLAKQAAAAGRQCRFPYLNSLRRPRLNQGIYWGGNLALSSSERVIYLPH